VGARGERYLRSKGKRKKNSSARRRVKGYQLGQQTEDLELMIN
jgi:hypothetical protein